ncbi:MAG TPA: FecR domain-containing protein [Flavitalea sp.]|nr:FecR domain-containing protein [Flavitalea sp.]
MNEFSEWYDNMDYEVLNIPEGFAGSEEELRNRILLAIEKRRKESLRSVYPTRTSFVKLTVAAALIIASTLSVLYIKTKDASQEENNSITGVSKRDTILPGRNKAILILGDGSEVLLDTVTSGAIAENVDARVVKLDDGELSYSALADINAPVSYNTLSTPRGGQYAITLVDGTRVWLNSSSSLRFPTSFRDPERTVELSGEAYFEVAENREKPFTVKVNDVAVKALGTHFNIMAYKDEATINTTLMEGSVAVSKWKETVRLNPGQQAQISENGKIGIVKNADIEQAIAWKNGFFNFSGSDIETTMRQIARWYNIEVIYESKITEHFNGTILRNASIERVLRMLEFTGVVSFDIQGRKIFVRS